MKKILFVLPLCAFLANCSSQKKTTTPPAGPGISNVNVSANGSAPTPVNASATSSTNRDWAYRSKSDTTLNGTWALQGIMGTSGTWTSLQDTSAAAANAMGTSMGTTGSTDTSAAMGTTGTDMAGATGNMGSDNSLATNTKATGKTKTKTNSRAVYDSARRRLSLDPTSPPSTIDSSLVGPYKYWGRTPVMTINATRHVFTGSTGCNSMSGSFNFSEKDIQFGRRISTSKMQCNEYDEAGFLAALQKVDNYTINGDQLELKQGNTLLLTFKRRA